jgi:hypothetical protein
MSWGEGRPTRSRISTRSSVASVTSLADLQPPPGLKRSEHLPLPDRLRPQPACRLRLSSKI